MSITDDIARFSGSDFETFCAVLLSAHDPTFQAVYGAGGDGGMDGFNVAGDTVFQVYGPKNTPTRSKVRTKIDDSIAKFRLLRDTDHRMLSNFVFVTNFDLTRKMHLDLRAAAEDAQVQAFQSWGKARLTRILASHPEIRRVFSETLLPDIVAALDSFEARQAAAQAEDDQRPRAPHIGEPEAEDPDERQWGSGLRPSISSVFFVLRPPEANEQHPLRSNAYWRAHVRAANLTLDGIAPHDEDGFAEATRREFGESASLAVSSRFASRVFLEHRGPALAFHRVWGRWANGLVTMASTLPDPAG